MNERDIFLALLDLPDPAERVKYLDAACNGDTDLRARVEQLIHSHESAGSFLDLSADSTRAIAAPDDAPTHAQGEQPDDDTDDALGFLAPSRRPDSLGRIGHYEVLEVLGRGGFGIVFRAFDDVLQRVVAVKVLAPSMAATSPARKRFLREARSAALIQHENVVRIHETGEEPLPFLVMEFVPGETLQHRLDRKGPLDVAEAIRIAQQIAAGLAAAHEKGLVHRDIKPSNILIDPGPQQVKITDFGLARAADDASLTRSGVVAGTPMYMAPEQAKGETLDQRADLFSLGSVVYAMLTGHPPFRAPNTPAVLRRVAEDDPRPMREVIPEIPEWLCRIVEKLHAKNPDERFQSAKEVAELLANCEQQLATHKELTDFAHIPGGKPKPQRRSIGRRWKWVAAAFAVLAILGFWFGPSVLLSLSNRGELEILPADGLVSVIVLQNDEGDLVTDKLHTPVTDWLGMKERQTLKLPPGRYQVNVNAYPSGTRVDQWEVTTSGVFGSSQNTVPVLRTSAIVTVERGQRTTLRAKMHTDPPRPEPPPSTGPTDGWVQLFNGKDLTGWEPNVNWTVLDNGVLSSLGQGRSSGLVSTRRDFENFHLRVEARINAGGNSGIFFRRPVGGKWKQDVYEVQINDDSDPIKTGSLWGRGLEHAVKDNPIRADEWFLLELIAIGNAITVKVNGKVTATWQDPNHTYTRGAFVLQQIGNNTVVQFRNIEIKELPPTSPEVPKRTADILAYIKGTWVSDRTIVVPKLPPEQARSIGQLTFDFVANGTVARGLTVDKQGHSTSLVLHAYDRANDRLSSWAFFDDGAVSASKFGVYNPASRRFLWTEPLPDGAQSIHDMDFVDANTVKSRNYDTDPAGNTVYESQATFTRTNQPPAVPKSMTDPKRPAEMKILDQLGGEWNNAITIKDAKSPDKPKTETVRATARPLLGGRFMEVIEANETTKTSDYTLVWYDAGAKRYRQTLFSHGGYVIEFTGTWDEATRTLTWKTADERLEGHWTFPAADRRDFRHAIKEAGQVQSEVTGVARKVASREQK